LTGGGNDGQIAASFDRCRRLAHTGYVGDDVESLLYRLIQEAAGDLEAPQRGFFYIDGIDKLGTSGTGGKDMPLGVRQDQAHEHCLVL
jgi:ATP-dependent protease Clp ATPase subunit